MTKYVILEAERKENYAIKNRNRKNNKSVI